MLRARREHAIRLEASFRDQVVDEDADVRLVASQLERRLAPRVPCRVDAGDDALRRRLFVAGRAVDLTREEQSRRLASSRGSGAARSAGRSRTRPRSRDAAGRRPRGPAARERGRPAPRAAGSSRTRSRRSPATSSPSGSRKIWCRSLSGKPDDLVLERRAVARTDAANLPVEQRRAVDVRAHDRSHAIVRVQQVAVDLRPTDRARQEREGHRRIVAALDGERSVRDATLEVDARAIEPRRRAGLQPPALEPDAPSATRPDRATAARRLGLQDAAPARCESGRSGTFPSSRRAREQRTRSPSSIASPTTRPCSIRIRPALPNSHSMFGSDSERRRGPSAL